MDSWAWNVPSWPVGPSHSPDLEVQPSPSLCPPPGANVPVERSIVADSRDHDHSVGGQLPHLANTQRATMDAIIYVLTEPGAFVISFILIITVYNYNFIGVF